MIKPAGNVYQSNQVLFILLRLSGFDYNAFMEKYSDTLHDLGELLAAGNFMLASAESCTGGLLGHLITNSPGSSDYYLGGMITYANEAKEKFLGVRTATLEAYGAVSRETVLEMAAGVRQAFSALSEKAVIGMAISGIAGPSGGTAEKPVGTVWIGLSAPGFKRAYENHFEGVREKVKAQSALQALRILKDYLQE